MWSCHNIDTIINDKLNQAVQSIPQSSSLSAPCVESMPGQKTHPGPANGHTEPKVAIIPADQNEAGGPRQYSRNEDHPALDTNTDNAKTDILSELIRSLDNDGGGDPTIPDTFEEEDIQRLN